MGKGGRPLKVDPRLDKAFMDIERGSNGPVIKLLQELGVDAFDRYKRTVLINAAFYGNIELMKWCLDNKAAIDFQDRNGMGALHFAAQEGRLEVAKLLLERGAQVDLQDTNGKSPLLTALLNWQGGRNEPMGRLLLDKGANPRLKNHHDVSPYDVMGEAMRKALKK